MSHNTTKNTSIIFDRHFTIDHLNWNHNSNLHITICTFELNPILNSKNTFPEVTCGAWNYRGYIKQKPTSLSENQHASKVITYHSKA